MGGKTENKTTATIDPAVSALQQGNFARAQTVADAPVTPYTGQLGAQLDPNVGASADTFKGLTSFAAPTVSGTTVSGVPHVTADQLATTDLTPYLNPHTKEVIDASAADSEQQRLVAQNANKAAAGAAGAYGGTRSAVQAGVTDSQNAIAFAQLAAQLRSQGYSAAQAAAMADHQLKLQADTTNQGVDLSVATGNADREQQARLANQGAALSSAGVQAASADSLGRLGLASTANTQYGLNAAYEEWLRQQQDPLVKQGLLNASLSGVSAPVSTTQVQTSNPGLFDYWKAASQAAAQAMAAGA
jgi:hypothetical protein